MQEGTNKVNYKSLIEDVQTFDFMADAEQPRSTATVKSGLTDVVAMPETKTVYDEEYIVLDSKKVPQSTIEQIEKKMIKINRKLKKDFKS